MSDTKVAVTEKITLEKIKEDLEKYIIARIEDRVGESIVDNGYIGVEDNISDFVNDFGVDTEALIETESEAIEEIHAEYEEEEDDENYGEEDVIDPIPDTDVFDAYDTGDAQAPIDDLKLS